MAVKKKKKKVIKQVGTAGAGIASHTVLNLARRWTKEYGTHVIEQRALPDYRDGLKPVHRRILWGTRAMGIRSSSAHIKSARVVGEVMGKYHPHGDMAIYDAIVNMEKQHLPVGLIDGQGNWGSITDNAAAMRYTECRPSKYADEGIMPSAYMAEGVINYVPNYDGSDKEPVFLPALYPNLLLNGTFGIAVGVTGGIPPLLMESLMPVIEARMSGKDITVKLMKKHIRFNYRYKPNCTSVDEDITKWLTTGNGGVIFSPDWKADEDSRTITITNVPPFFNWENVVKRLSKHDKIISDVDDLTSKASGNWPIFQVRLKRSIAKEDVYSTAKKILNSFDTTVRMATNITKRYVNEEKETAEAKFDPTTPTNLIALWTDYRVQLEKDFQKYRIGVIDGQIFHQETLKLAVLNIDKVIKIIRASQDAELALVQKLKITPEQAKIIADIQLRRLSKLGEGEINAKIKQLKSEKVEAKKHYNAPEKKALSDMNAGLHLFSKEADKKKRK